MSFNFKHKEQKMQQVVNYSSGKRPLSKVYWYILLMAIISPFIYLGYNIFIETFMMSATGQIYFKEVTLRAPASAYIKKIFLHPGEQFGQDQSIIELESPQLLSQLQSLQEEKASLSRKKAVFMDNGGQLGHLLEAKNDAAKYVADCREYLNSMTGLRGQGVTTIVDVEKARNDLNLAQQQYAAIEGSIAKLSVDKNLQSEEYFDKSIRETEAKIKNVNTSISLLNIRGQEMGTIAKILVQENEYVKEGQDIANIIIKRDTYINAYIESKFLSEKLIAGQDVRIVLPDGLKIKGRMTYNPILAESDPTKSNLVQNDKNKIVVRVVPQEDVPERYLISGLPVDILFY